MIETDSEYSRFTLRAVDESQEDLGANLEIKSDKVDRSITSPSFGALFWLDEKFCYFWELFQISYIS